MISQNDILLFKKKIISARALLMRNNSFFALLLMHMRYVAVPGMEQISTNGETIFFSPELMKKYNQNEVCSLLCHQILHIIMGDIWRPLTLKGDDYHYEKDIVVNAELKACGIGLNYFYVRSISDKDIYDDWGYVVDKLHRRMVDTDEFWSYELHDVENGVVILEAEEDIWAQYNEHTKKHSNNKPQSNSGAGFGYSKGNRLQLKSVWAKLAQQYGKHGNVSMCIRRSFMNDGVGRLNWRKLLADFVQEEIFDYSFCPPDRRYEEIGIFLPDYNEKQCVVQDVLFMVDTSGSISSIDLKEAYAEIQHAIDLFNGNLRGMLGFFDADVIDPIPFSSVNDVINITPYGGGGTDFRPIFDYMAQHYADKLPACLIIYTDGFGTFPRSNATLGIPILWLINNNEVTPPFGKVARIEAFYEKMRKDVQSKKQIKALGC